MSRHHSSLAAPPLDDEDLLQEILLRLPPKPSSFPRASAVCKRWCSILTDPRFLCRFRKHHKKPTLLGFFDKQWCQAPVFTPMLDPPDRIPAASFALPENLHGLELGTKSLTFHGCRHGIALFLDRNRQEAVLWDPLTCVQRHVSFPPGFEHGKDKSIQSATVFASSDNQHVHANCHMSPFKLVLVCHDTKYTKASICMYDSKSGVWGGIISTATTDVVSRKRPSILVGNRLCWLLDRCDILKFDFERLTLAVIERPASANGYNVDWLFQILRGEDNGLGLAALSLSTMSIQLWARKSNCDGVFSWVLQTTVQLRHALELLSQPACLRTLVQITGYDEDTNVIFLYTNSHDFILQLESKQFTCISGRECKSFGTYYPYTIFYTAVRGIAGGDGGPENVNK